MSEPRCGCGPDGVFLILSNDWGDYAASLCWLSVTPTFVSLHTRLTGNRLLRSDLEALRTFCDQVLERMDVTTPRNDTHA